MPEVLARNAQVSMHSHLNEDSRLQILSQRQKVMSLLEDVFLRVFTRLNTPYYCGIREELC